MQNDKDILKRVGRNDGMTVPENYFQEFAEKMTAMLPETPAVQSPVRLSLWNRVKPYVYMAAMFAGILCMMKMFSMMSSGKAGLNIENYPALTATLEEGGLTPVILEDYNQYEILDDIYNEGFSADDIFMDKDSDFFENEEAPENPDYILP